MKAGMLRTAVEWTVYPLVMTLTLVLYYGMLAFGVSLTLSTYIASTIGGLGFITLFEILLPHRKEWLPNRQEIRTDAVYMIFIQILLPYLLSLLTVLWLAQLMESKQWLTTRIWPHHWPDWLQMLLMMFTADFFRYWLHRASHTWEFLWRFHAVHHSVKKLYWFNVGRFHPIDKAFQFVCDAMPFILLGVSKEVMSLYFVIYAIKGFFQHSNVDAKLGWLNYIISGPELHRWHHSRVIRESNSNYGNNVIVWDLLFGSFFLPPAQSVSELGLINPDYPSGFFEQLEAPFISGLDKEGRS